MLTGDMTDSGARLAHVGIALPDIAAALPFYRDVLGLEPTASETADGATIIGLSLGDVQVELLEPQDPEAPRLVVPVLAPEFSSLIRCIASVSSALSFALIERLMLRFLRSTLMIIADTASPSFIRRRPPASCWS